MEGLAGVVDEGKLFRKIQFSPRWPAAGVHEAQVRIEYGASCAGFGYEYLHDEARGVITVELKDKADINLHLLLPFGLKAKRVTFKGKSIPFHNVKIEQSRYADAHVDVKRSGILEIKYS